MLIRFKEQQADTAAKRIAKVLTDAGFSLPARGKRKTLPQVIIDWRYRLNTGPGGAPTFALRQWQTYQTMIAPEIESVDVDAWLEHLKTLAASTRSD